MGNRSRQHRLAIGQENIAEAGDEILEAPWSTEALLADQAYLREIDVCGAMSECEAGTCPCGALKTSRVGSRASDS